MSEFKHTPLPWKAVSAPNFDNGNVYTSIQPVNVDEEAMKPLAMMDGEYHVCRMSHSAAEWRFAYHRDNAAFIVEACNAYYDHKVALAAKDAEIARLREALSKAADQLTTAHDDAFNQAGGYGLLTSDGRDFSCMELNKCETAAREARAALKEQTP